MNIAFIANGESATYTKNGEFIDKCDIVVRLGLSVTEGYEDFVGTKSSIYGTAKWKFIPKPHIPVLWMVEDIDREYDDELREFLEYDKYSVTRNETFEKYRPTIGTRFLHKTMREFKNSSIYVKGFDFFSTGHYFNINHRPGIYSSCSHPIFLERIYYSKLLRDNKIHPI